MLNDDNHELQELESTLQHLQPQASKLQRDAILFRAGEQTMRRRLRRWQAGSAMIALLCVGVLVWRMNQPPAPAEVRYVRIPQPKPAPFVPVAPTPEPQPPRDQVRPSESPSREFVSRDIAYYRLQRHLLRWGFDGLQSPTPPPEPAPDEQSLADLRGFQPVASNEYSFFSSWIDSYDKE